MADNNPPEDYGQLLKLESAFVDNITDDAVREHYFAARRGDAVAFNELNTIAKEGWDDPANTTLRHAEADRAIELICWFRMKTQ